jgi:hypothetical protein
LEFEEDDHMVASVPLSELTDRLASVSHSAATGELSAHHQAEHSGAHCDAESSVTATREKAADHEGSTEVTASTAVKTAAVPAVSPVRVSMDKKQESVLMKPVVKLMTVEERGEGAVGWGVYQSYFQAANKPLLIVCLLLSFVLGTDRFSRLSTDPH